MSGGCTTPYNSAMHVPDPWINGPQILVSRARQRDDGLEGGGLALLRSKALTKAIITMRSECFSGNTVNRSEGRAAGHWALRLAGISEAPAVLPKHFSPRGHDLLPSMQSAHQRTAELAEQIRNGRLKTSSGKSCSEIIHLGIGGSDTGPRLLIDALRTTSTHDGPRAHFFPNLDPHDLFRTLPHLDPRTCLVIMVSKSFGTLETLANADCCLRWMRDAGITAPHENFFAVTAVPEKAIDWGIPMQQVLEFDESIGGRFSVWGPVSLSARIVLGNTTVDQVLEGAVEMDAHFLESPLEENLPALLAATDFHHLRHKNIPSLMVSAYDSRLDLLVPYLSQLWMESLGKGEDQQGRPIPGPACPLLWGSIGTNAQHSFFQLLHQGKNPVAIDLIGVLGASHASATTHQALLGNLFAQAQVLAIGQQDADPKKSCTGGHPVNLIMLEQLDGKSLGSLLALWEHRVMCLAALGDINPFDQWGVEAGKRIAQTAFEALRGDSIQTDALALDETSLALIQSLKQRGLV